MGWGVPTINILPTILHVCTYCDGIFQIIISVLIQAKLVQEKQISKYYLNNILPFQFSTFFFILYVMFVTIVK